MIRRHHADRRTLAACVTSLALLLAACTPTTAAKRPDRPDAATMAAKPATGEATKTAPFPSTYRAPSAPEVLTSPTVTWAGPVPLMSTTPLLPSPIVETVAAPARAAACAPVIVMPLVAGVVVATVTAAGAFTVISVGAA
jgi:hypothetical protein